MARSGRRRAAGASDALGMLLGGRRFNVRSRRRPVRNRVCDFARRIEAERERDAERGRLPRGQAGQGRGRRPGALAQRRGAERTRPAERQSGRQGLLRSEGTVLAGGRLLRHLPRHAQGDRTDDDGRLRVRDRSLAGTACAYGCTSRSALAFKFSQVMEPTAPSAMTPFLSMKKVEGMGRIR